MLYKENAVLSKILFGLWPLPLMPISDFIVQNQQYVVSYDVLKHLRIAPDCIFERLHECAYDYTQYLKDAE